MEKKEEAVVDDAVLVTARRKREDATKETAWMERHCERRERGEGSRGEEEEEAQLGEEMRWRVMLGSQC